VRNRTRTLLAGTLLAAIGLVAFAPHASAQEEEGEVDAAHLGEELEHQLIEDGASEFDAECALILGEGGSVDDCQEAPQIILPATDELVWGALSFVVLLFLMWKFAYPAVTQGLQARTERIRSDLDAAEHAKTEATDVLDGYRAQLADAKTEAARIIEEARQAADALKKDQETRLQTELADTRARAMADIEAAKVQATADLRGELAALAVGAASAVVNKNLDAAAQTQLIEDYISSVGSPS
jgi:F-type H+-transporting ATPase subunit b